MSRTPKKGTYMNFKLDNLVVEQLNRYSEETMIPKTRIVEKALSEFFENTKNAKKSIGLQQVE